MSGKVITTSKTAVYVALMLDLLIFACTERPSAGSSGSGVTVTKITLNSNTTHRMEIEVSPPSRRESEAPDDDTLEVSSKILSEFLRFCVVRIRSSSQALDIWRPYSRGQPQSSVGTGFAVKLISGGYQQEDALANPIFITNAHVVNNAHAVLVSIPALSDEEFPAFVPDIYNDLDLAIVQLSDPQRFQNYIKQTEHTLHYLPVRDVPVYLGMPVLAMGFPLGVPSPKMTPGIISGTEDGNGRLSLQTNAPISPGNSGGPLVAAHRYESMEELLKHGGPQLIGVNFQSVVGAGAQNTNYAIPGIFIQQLLHAHLEVVHSQLCDLMGKDLGTHWNNCVQEVQDLVHRTHAEWGSQIIQMNLQTCFKKRHQRLQIAPMNILPQVASDAFYVSEGCKEGVFIKKMWQPSLFESIGIGESFFLTAVGDVKLDKSGKGRLKDKFLEDDLLFSSLMSVQPRLDGKIKIKVCHKGQDSEHEISLNWDPKYMLGVRRIFEPQWEVELLDFETFGGVTVMQLTQKHVEDLVQMGRGSLVSDCLKPGGLLQPRLIISDVMDHSYAQQVVVPGMLVASVNGRDVTKLSEFREIMEESCNQDYTWTMTTVSGTEIRVNFQKELKRHLERISLQLIPATRVMMKIKEKVFKTLDGGALLQTANLPNTLEPAAKSFIKIPGTEAAPLQSFNQPATFDPTRPFMTDFAPNTIPDKIPGNAALLQPFNQFAALEPKTWLMPSQDGFSAHGSEAGAPLREDVKLAGIGVTREFGAASLPVIF